MARNKPKFTKERPPDASAVTTDWRLFLAIPMPPPVQSLAADLTARLAPHHWPVRWVAADATHLTLHFLGDTPPERGELLRLSLATPVAKVPRFSLQTNELGVFPDYRNPRVLWLGLKGETDRLAHLHHTVGRHLASLDFPVERRDFHPHITLGRVRDEPPRTLGASVRQAYDEPETAALVTERPASFDVTEVLLIRSYIERGGARHEVVARYPLSR